MKIFFLIYALAVLTFSAFFFQDSDLEESMQRGSEIYMDFCITCHLHKGEGVENTFPPLAKSDYLMNNREASIRGVKYGQQGEIIIGTFRSSLIT